MDKIKRNLASIITVGAVVLGLIFALILPGAVASEENVSGTVSFFGIVFGGGPIVAKVYNTTVEQAYAGGMSIFGLLSFLLAVAGIALIVIQVVKGNDKLGFIGNILIAVAGIFAFLLLAAGTDVTVTIYEGYSATGTFAEQFKEFAIGAGAVIYGILALAGGAFGILNKFKKIV